MTPAVLFHLYSQQFRMRQDIVLLARQEALRTAVPGTGLSQLSVELPGRGDSFETPIASDDSSKNSGERRE